VSRKTLPTGNARPRGRELDAELVAMVKARAETAADPADGFVSAMHEHDRTLAIDGLMIYAWGPSAAVLAKNLGMTPSRTRRLVEPVAPPVANECPRCGAISVPLSEHTCPYKLLAAAPEPGKDV
jgi:hypothetical protein